MLGSTEIELTNREIIFEDFQSMWSWYLNGTDGQTDGLPQQYRALRGIAQ